MDILFLDANVLFAAAYREAAPIGCLWKLEEVELVTSAYAVEEARRNLPRPEHVDRLVKLLQQCRVVPESLRSGTEIAGVDLPEKDRPILLAAKRAGATHLLTGDYRHFGRYYGKTVLGMIVSSPVDYLHSHLP